jgi:uncharacterized phage infection (PIP) family protein YhgE
MKKLLFVTAFAVIAFGQPSFAADSLTVKDALNEISKLAAEKGELQKGFQTALSIKRELEDRDKSLAQTQQQIARRKADLESYCTGTFPEPEYSRRVARCDSEGRTLNEQIDTYNDGLTKLSEGYQALATAVKKMVARDSQIDQRLQYLMSRLKSIEIFAASSCSDEHELETAVDCFNHVWDRSSRQNFRISDPPQMAK